MNKYLFVGSAIGIVMVAGAVWLHGYQTGYSRASDFYVREQELQEAANREAMRRADRLYSELVEEIEDAKRTIQAQVEASDAIADADPDALLCGISAAASMRIGTIR